MTYRVDKVIGEVMVQNSFFDDNAAYLEIEEVATWLTVEEARGLRGALTEILDDDDRPSVGTVTVNVEPDATELEKAFEKIKAAGLDPARVAAFQLAADTFGTDDPRALLSAVSVILGEKATGVFW